MKRCPECDRTYTDDTLNFCLDDGAWLQADEPETAILTSELATRVHNAAPSSPYPGTVSADVQLISSLR